MHVVQSADDSAMPLSRSRREGVAISARSTLPRGASLNDVSRMHNGAHKPRGDGRRSASDSKEGAAGPRTVKKYVGSSPHLLPGDETLLLDHRCGPSVASTLEAVAVELIPISKGSLSLHAYWCV